MPERIRGCQVYMAHIDDSNDPTKVRKTACTIVSAKHLITYAHGTEEAIIGGRKGCGSSPQIPREMCRCVVERYTT